jgi:hemerythrin superfamily protein
MAKVRKPGSTGGHVRQGLRQHRAATQQDAIELLKGDHRQVEKWFGQFESARSDERKQDLARQICGALKVHTQIEEEVFYPAFLESTEEKHIHHEAEIEHNGAKQLISDIEASGPDDDYFEARVSVLSDMIKHHVNEEEKRDGMFAKARKAGMDLVALGEQFAARKAELVSDAQTAGASARSRSQRAHAESARRL